MDELIAFVWQQLDEDERAVGAACIHIDDCNGSGYADRFDDDRLLAEVKAKRAILELHEMTAEPLTGQPACRRCIEAPGEPAGWPCLTVRLLAQPYAGRPGWREEWSV